MGAGAVEAGDAERVLAALEARAAGAAPPPPGGLADWRRCPKFHHAVSALAGWAGAGGGGEAAARVQALERELRGLQAPLDVAAEEPHEPLGEVRPHLLDAALEPLHALEGHALRPEAVRREPEVLEEAVVVPSRERLS